MKPRRTQADRKATTRRAILDAAIRSLVELGYAKTTTTEVTSRAGVSQGALFKHFPTKEILVATVAAELCESLFPKFRRAMRTHRTGKDVIERAIRGLWSVFETDQVRVLHELYAAAPTEPALREALAPILKRHRENILEEARLLFPELAEMENYDRAVDLVITSMQGAALVLFTGRDKKRERLFLQGLAVLVRSAPLFLASADRA